MNDTSNTSVTDTINQFLAASNLIIPQVTSLITIGVFAVQQLWSVWAKDNPDKTFEDFIAELRANAGEVKDLAAEQLHRRGFVQTADGTWFKPAPADPV